jgi:predicted RNA binding protein YcfA (HicA-like mRNA interferase family)
MPKYPVLRAREIIKILNNLGFEQIRQRGSHKQFRHPDGRQTTVPDHKGRDVSPALTRQISRDIGLSMDEFMDAR